MAVTVKIDDKKRAAQAAPGQPAPPPPAALNDFISPTEKTEGYKALGLWLAILCVICGPFWIRSESHPIAYGMTSWCVISSLIYLWIWPNLIARRLRVQKDGILNAQNQPRLKALLQKGSGLLGVSEPQTFLENEGAPRVLALPRYLVVRQAIFGLLEPDEVNCLVVRGLVHLRQHHARRLGVILLLSETERAVLLLMWPVVIYGSLLRAFWLKPAQETADRLALLLVKNHRLMISAILKEHAAIDPEMQEMEVTSADVTNYIAQSGHIGMEGREISTQYKLGRAIHENPVLEERLQSLSKWAESPNFKTAVQKLAEARKK